MCHSVGVRRRQECSNVIDRETVQHATIVRRLQCESNPARACVAPPFLPGKLLRLFPSAVRAPRGERHFGLVATAFGTTFIVARFYSVLPTPPANDIEAMQSANAVRDCD